MPGSSSPPEQNPRITSALRQRHRHKRSRDNLNPPKKEQTTKAPQNILEPHKNIRSLVHSTQRSEFNLNRHRQKLHKIINRTISEKVCVDKQKHQVNQLVVQLNNGLRSLNFLLRSRQLSTVVTQPQRKCNR